MKKILILIFVIGIFAFCYYNIFKNDVVIHNNKMIEKQKIEEIHFKSVGVSEFKKELTKQDGILIDIRTSEEVIQGVISGAINIDYYSLDFKEKLNALDKNRKYLIYCRSGSRSKRTLVIMRDLGFKNVINLEGGIISWENVGETLEALKEKV